MLCRVCALMFAPNYVVEVDELGHEWPTYVNASLRVVANCLQTKSSV